RASATRCSSTPTSRPTTCAPTPAVSAWWSTRPAPPICGEPASTTRTASRAPGSRSTTPTPPARAVAGSRSADLALTFTLDGCPVEVDDDGASLLEVLRDRLGVRSPKDGCSPQGQCGCCTVLIDGAPRVACVTPARRAAGRDVTTLEGLDDGTRQDWADRFTAHGASQCGFCTPGIIMRLSALAEPTQPSAVEQALLAHLCRCTGWRTIVDAATKQEPSTDRDWAAAARRAELEGHTPQQVGPHVALGHAGFAD